MCIRDRPSTGESQVRRLVRPSLTIPVTLLGTYAGHPALAHGKPGFLILYFCKLSFVLHYGSCTKTYYGVGSGLPATLGRFEIAKAVDDLYCEDFMVKSVQFMPGKRLHVVFDAPEAEPKRS